ncbi:MAG: hypothetical protein P8M72_09230 [Gammaproteobacteria bacterium]|nr:hypothetical protein [Gammaproteobacteria bacterium]
MKKPVLIILLFQAMLSMTAIAADYNPDGATPRLANGNPNLGAQEDGLGNWGRGPGPMVAGAFYPPPEEVPFKPWSRALYDYRQATLAKDDPHVRCAPPGGPRQFAVPFGLQLVQVPHMNKIFIHSGGSTRPWREIHMGSSSHPDYVNPSYFGHSIGHWEGDTLIVDTIGFNERFWIHREGYPHTESLQLIERISRPKMDTLRYEVTLDDPVAYTAPWSTVWTKTWDPGVEFIEYFCQDNNIDQFHMMGNESLVR